MEFVSRKCKDSGYPSIRNMMYLWDTRTKTIEVMSHPPTQWEKDNRLPHNRSGGGCHRWFKENNSTRRKVRLLADMMALIVRDKLDPLEVHKAFLKIREYRETCAADMPFYDGWKYEDINIMD